MATRRCPHCRIPMTHRTSHGVELDVCDRCGGLWFDEGEFDALVAQRFHSRDLEQELEQTANFPEWCRFCRLDQSGWEQCQNCGLDLGLHCPVDHTAMYIVTFGTIELDRCGECRGIWVDGFERKDLSKQELPAMMRSPEELFPDMSQADEPENGSSRAGGDWGQGADWTTGAAVTAGAASATGRILETHEINRELSCAGCDASKPRYALAERDGRLWCQRCIYLGLAPTPAIAPRDENEEGAARRRRASLHQPCDQCEQVFIRHLLWEFDGLFWCTECGSRDALIRKRMELARTIGETSMQYERERAAQREYADRLQHGRGSLSTFGSDAQLPGVHHLIGALGRWLKSR